MKRKTLSKVLLLLTFFLLIPATLYLGTKLSGRSYYLTSTLVIMELLVPFFLAFERRKHQARELVLIAVMCALAIVGRVAIPIPHFKAAFAIIMLTGVAFGPQTGFMVGAITAFTSNFFYGQGPYTPWQMFAYGAAGMLAGFCFHKAFLPRKGWVMAVFGFFAVALLIGPLMDTSSLFLAATTVNLRSALMVYASGFLINLIQGLSTAALLLLLSKPLLDRLDRMKLKYGIMAEI